MNPEKTFYKNYGAIESIDHDLIVVEIEAEVETGNLKTDIPNISVDFGQMSPLMLTWDEARKLAKVLVEVTDLAEFG